MRSTLPKISVDNLNELLRSMNSLNIDELYASFDKRGKMKILLTETAGSINFTKNQVLQILLEYPVIC